MRSGASNWADRPLLVNQETRLRGCWVPAELPMSDRHMAARDRGGALNALSVLCPPARPGKCSGEPSPVLSMRSRTRGPKQWGGMAPPSQEEDKPLQRILPSQEKGGGVSGEFAMLLHFPLHSRRFSCFCQHAWIQASTCVMPIGTRCNTNQNLSARSPPATPHQLVSSLGRPKGGVRTLGHFVVGQAATRTGLIGSISGAIDATGAPWNVSSLFDWPPRSPMGCRVKKLRHVNCEGPDPCSTWTP